MRDARRPIELENPDGAGPFVIVCDHASNRIPDDYASFAFADDALATHVAWDPGALSVARRLSTRLNAPLLWPDVSRLVIDCNRAPDAASLIVTESEGRKVEANCALPQRSVRGGSPRFTRPIMPRSMAVSHAVWRQG